MNKQLSMVIVQQLFSKDKGFPLWRKEKQRLNLIKDLLIKTPGLDKYSMNIYNAPALETGISNFLQYKEVDLAAMRTKGRKDFFSPFSKSFTKGATIHSELPVITLKCNDE